MRQQPQVRKPTRPWLVLRGSPGKYLCSKEVTGVSIGPAGGNKASPESW